MVVGPLKKPRADPKSIKQRKIPERIEAILIRPETSSRKLPILTSNFHSIQSENKQIQEDTDWA
jgi:hypothetical protein